MTVVPLATATASDNYASGKLHYFFISYNTWSHVTRTLLADILKAFCHNINPFDQIKYPESTREKKHDMLFLNFHDMRR